MSDKLANPRLIEIEGMAMTGYLESVETVECQKPRGWKRLRVRTKDGRVLETGCMDEEAAKRNYMVMLLYIRKWGELVNEDAPKKD